MVTANLVQSTAVAGWGITSSRTWHDDRTWAGQRSSLMSCFGLVQGDGIANIATVDYSFVTSALLYFDSVLPFRTIVSVNSNSIFWRSSCLLYSSLFLEHLHQVVGGNTASQYLSKIPSSIIGALQKAPHSSLLLLSPSHQSGNAAGPTTHRQAATSPQGFH